MGHDRPVSAWDRADDVRRRVEAGIDSVNDGELRKINFTNNVRERVLAGTDRGLGHRVGHSSICWAKLGALAEGALRASAQLWGRA